MNFNHLYYFHVTATEGSIKAAAERLGITQPTVSEQVRLLERSLGVQLFDRSAGGLRLTQAGREALDHTRTMFLASERLRAALAKTNGPPPITLRVGVSGAISRTLAARFLLPVLTLERCRPVIRTADFNDLLRELRSHDLDLVLGETEPAPLPKESIEVALVHRPVLVAIVGRDVEPAADWSDLLHLEYSVPATYRADVGLFLETNGKRPVLAGELDDAFLMYEAVAQGRFVAFVPRSIARDGIQSGRVKMLATLEPSSGIHAVFHAGDELALARVVVERLVQNARDQLDAD